MQLLARAALVDAHHGHTNGPRRLSDAQAQVAVVGVDVAPFLRGFDDLYDRTEDAVFQVAFFEFAE